MASRFLEFLGKRRQSTKKRLAIDSDGNDIKQATVSADQSGKESTNPQNADLKILQNPFDHGKFCPQRPETDMKILRLTNWIRSVPDWENLLGDSEFEQTWSQAETMGLVNSQTPARDHGLDSDSEDGLDMDSDSEPEIDTKNSVRKQLLNLAKFKDQNIQVSVGNGIYECGALLDDESYYSFMEHAVELEDFLRKKKDWHPGSNGFVWDLVHPSLYCLVYGVTRRTQGDPKPWREWLGTGEIIPKVKRTKQQAHRSRGGRGGRTWYETVPDPYWGDYQWIPSDVSVDSLGKTKITSYINNLHPSHGELYKDIQSILSKFIPMFEQVLTYLLTPPTEDRVLMPPQMIEKPISLHNRELQIMLKMSNFELTPEKPFYEGGQWHVEALKNEGIVAVGIYYYKNENITESRLSMRQGVVSQGWNTRYHHQDLGDVIVREGMGLAFPNIFQHRVAPFELVDKTKNGYRKFLVIFLVDPSRRILSTRDIPPQQKEWMLREMRPDDMELPQLVVEKIFEEKEWPMSLAQAKEHREKLIVERNYWADYQVNSNREINRRVNYVD